MNHFFFVIAMIMFPCVLCGMEKKAEQSKSIISANKVNSDPLSLDTLPNELLNEIVLYLVDWQALKIFNTQEAKKGLLALKQTNKHFAALIRHAEKKYTLNENYIWRTLQEVSKTNNLTKMQETLTLIKSRPQHRVSYSECFKKYSSDIGDSEGLNLLLEEKDKTYLQSIAPNYQLLAKKTLDSIRWNRVNNNFSYYNWARITGQLTFMLLIHGGVVTSLLIALLIAAKISLP